MDGWRQGAVGAAMRAWALALALACLVPWPAWASVAGISNVRFQNYSVAQGLPQASVNAIAQDARGFLWFGTQDGLARFDGYEFQVFQHVASDPDSLSDNFITSLVAAPDGGLWAGTQVGGLDHFDPATGRFTHFRAVHGAAHGLAANKVLALALGRHGRLWIATLGARLQWIDPGSDTVHTAPLGARAALGNVHTMLALADGDLLVGTSVGLWRVNAQATQMQLWGAGQQSAPLNVYALAVGAHGDVWVGTGTAGLYHFNADGSLQQHFLHAADDADSLPDDQIRALHFDHQGRLWIAGNARGLGLLLPGTSEFRNFAHNPADPQSVTANRIWSLAVDRDGLVIAGSLSNGFSVHDPATEMFTQISSIPNDPQALPSPDTDAVYGDADGSLWIGMLEDGGLVKFDPTRGVVARYVHDPKDPTSLAGDSVLFVTRARDGNLWVAVMGAGLDRMRRNGKDFAHIHHDPDDPGSLASNVLRYVYVDSRGTLWVATKDAGLDERCAGCTAFVHHRPGGVPGAIDDIGDINVSHVTETRDGAIWVTTLSAGIYRRAAGAKRFQAIRADNQTGLSSNADTTVFQDSRGDLWVGTQGGGLDVLRGANPAGRFVTINQDSGLASNYIGEILEDAHGYIWTSTLKGISRIDPRTLAVQNFSAHSGASERGYWVNAGSRLADGRLAFGGLNGVTIVAPHALIEPPTARPVITAVVLRGQRYAAHAALPDGSVWRGGDVRLTHRQDDFGAEFSSLEYSAPGTTQYAHRLVGYDSKWIVTPASRRIAYYTNLPAGTYHLEVRARHEGGPWSAATADLTFTVAAPPWATRRAYAAYVAALLLLGAIAGWRVRANLRRRRTARNALAQSEARLKLALWGSGSEMWDADLRTGQIRHENRLPNLAVDTESPTQTLRAYRAFLHPDDAPAFDAALREHLAGRTDNFEASYRTLDRAHNWVWLLTRGRVIERDEKGWALRLTGTSSDITQLKQAEASLRNANDLLEQRVAQRTHELNAANTELRTLLDQLTQAQDQLVEAEKLASLGGLVAGVAHEINTPLGVGVTAASYLHDEAMRLAKVVADGVPDAAVLHELGTHIGEGADLILRNLRRADQLVKSFKQVAVDQAGGDVREINVKQCVEGVVTTLRPSLRHTPHTIAIDGPDDLIVRSSPGALGQIITNLVMNSLTHGFEAGQAGHIAIALQRTPTGVLVDYQDDGKGMSPEVRAHVYEPFFTTRRGQGGSGLGMHIVYTLVTQILRGGIVLNTSPGAGVRFRIAFGNLPNT